MAFKHSDGFNNLYKSLMKELRIVNKKTFEIHTVKNLENVKAKLQYQKFQLIKAKQPITAITKEIDHITSQSKLLIPPPIATAKVKKLLDQDTETQKGLNNLSNVVNYFQSQRVYNVLLQRYNPGMNVDQADNVRKTANRVGLHIPE